MRKLIPILSVVLFFFSCSPEEQEKMFSISTSSIDASIAAGTKLVNITSNTSWTAAPQADWLAVSPSSGKGNEVVKISWTENKGAGRRAKLVFNYGSGTAELSIYQAGEGSKDEPVSNLNVLSAKLSLDIIHSRGVLLYKQKNIMQGFDFTDATHYYYSQGPASDIWQYVSTSSGPNTNTGSYMKLERFGHMTQIVAEKAGDGKTYIWCNSNGQSTSDGYGNNWSFSRIEYKAGGSYTGGYAGDTFFLNKDNQYDTQVSIDFDARRLLVGSRKAGVSMRYFWVFDLDEVLSLPLKTMTCNVNLGTNSSISGDGTSRTETRTLPARDLNDAKVLGYFAIPRGTTSDQVYYYSHQGHEVHGEQIWFYEGNAVEDGDKYNSYAYVTVFDYKGNVLIPRTAVKAIEDRTALSSFGLTKIGYAEGESMKVKDGKLYLGLGCNDGAGTYRYADILCYDLNQ